MRSPIHKSRAFVLLVSGLLLALQVSGLHVHLCFDGQSQPLQVHVVDAPGGAPAVDLGVPHVDEVVRLSTAAPARGIPAAPDLLPVFPVWRVMAIAPSPGNFQSIERVSSDPPSSSFLELLPPPRGPPLTPQA